MPISAIDTPTQVVISQNGIKGDTGTDGIDGVGFSAVRKSLIDNPLSWLYKKNHLVSQLNNLLTVDRAVGGSYTDIYGATIAAGVDEPREEANGWLITSDETHTFNVVDNIPLLNSGFTVVLELGYYLGNTVSQDIIVIPALSGDLFSIGTDALGNFVATMQGSDAIEYTATSTVSSAVTTLTTLIAFFDGVNLNLYIGGSLAGTIPIPTGIPAVMDFSNVTINGDFTLNMRGLRVYDIVFNSDEITYLS